MTHGLLHLITAACLTTALLSACSRVQYSDYTRAVADNTYWVTSSSGKTHNKSCRYFMRGKGSLTPIPSGENCKLCGGSVKR